ncbi:uncharacterized protein LOC107705288 [Sinocyclocheilus rhinocerous]|uniref:uncharacterized protein LOC107705288 n=1 Tax=Sinocyclocheilus rhinocerous TaxID=307959 RepID=UPI0007B7E23E|nr:PREDICTED: uncharacterized protein LOC107705288 [Sinocyclocheilus rhinocerous]
MMLIFGLMLLLQSAACLDRFCWFGQSDPCYTALEDKLSLQMLNASKYNLKIIKRINNTADDPVCRIKNDTMRIKECDLYNNRSEVTVINGTLIINRVIRADSGNYRLTLDHSDGTETSRDLQVIVEDHPVALIVLGSLAVILIVLVIIAYYVYKKKNQLKPTNVENASTGPQTNRNEKKEQELHYGEVMFTDRKVQQQPCKTQEECLYAQVQTR